MLAHHRIDVMPNMIMIGYLVSRCRDPDHIIASGNCCSQLMMMWCTKLGWSFTTSLNYKVAIWWGFIRLTALAALLVQIGADSLKKLHHITTLWYSEVVNDHPICRSYVVGITSISIPYTNLFQFPVCELLYSFSNPLMRNLSPPSKIFWQSTLSHIQPQDVMTWGCACQR